MLELVFSNRAEALIEALAERVAARQVGDGFWKPIPILVPNPLVKRFVREGLAARNGAVANLDFAFLESRLERALPDGKKLWTPETLMGRLLLHFEGRDLEPELAAYLAGTDRPRKALQLAQRLGARFHDYALHRPDWVRAWRKGQEAGKAGWQGQLFRVVDAELSKAGFLCPADLADEAPRLAWPEGAALVSLNTLAPSYLEAMRCLGERMDLAFFVLNPCEEFWADHPTRKAFLEGGEAPEGHPALGLWGRPGRDFVARLYDAAEGQDEPRFESPGRATLLRALQDDIRALRPPEPFTGSDASIRILAAPGPRREAEVVASEIWTLLESEGWTFQDFAVVIPAGSAEAYLEHLRAAFEATGKLPLAFEAATAGPAALLAEACALLLDLLDSDMSRARVLRFFAHPACAVRYPDLDPEALLGFCERSGILRGLDDAAFKGTYLSGLDRLSWEQGLTRAALGAFLPEGACPPGRDLPALAESDREAPLALARLVADLRAWRDRIPAPPKVWSDAFLDLVESHLGDASEAWVRARQLAREKVSELSRLAPEGLPTPTLAFAEIRSLMHEKLARLDERPEGGAGIRVSTGLPMRAVPFRAVFVMGLGEGLFPAPDRVDPLDLRQGAGAYRGSDLSRAEQDRYLFLELILSARDALRLSYPSADPVSGEDLPCSSVLEELKEILEAMTGDANTLVESHPLRRFDSTYFRGGALRSLAPEAAREAEALAGSGVVAALHLPTPSPKETIRVNLTHLRAWLEEPVEGSAQVLLGLRSEEEDGGAEDCEALDLDRYDATVIEQEALERIFKGEARGEALARIWREAELEGRAPLGPPGAFARRSVETRLAAWVPLLGEAGPFVVHHFGRTRPALEFDVPVHERIVRISLEGRTEAASASCLARLEKSKIEKVQLLRARLRLRLSQVVLAAAGDAAPATLVVLDEKGEAPRLPLAAPPQDEAQALLKGWLGALVSELPVERLPIAFAVEKDRSDPQGWIAARDRKTFRASWSRLPAALRRSLPAPDAETAEAALRFRLGPLYPEGEAP
ncbi:MAG: exodeoxyribonuclease V subunit gamma [Acidobacteria bacterium]|nr:exodeoxyribonuclease V subunit gamma [Acidobacteriota bacterium]